MTKSDSKSKSKPKSSATAKAGLEVKPVKDLEPADSQSEDVRGGNGGAAGPGVGKNGGGLVFSDATLKSRVAPLRSALAKLGASFASSLASPAMGPSSGPEFGIFKAGLRALLFSWSDGPWPMATP